MKLTPLDIHHKEFRHSIRGYNEEEVDQFLDEVADEFERLFKENIDLSEKLEALQTKVNEFELQRQTINNTLVNAQRSADDILSRANEEADGIVAHANTRAKGIVNDALAKKQQVRGELLRIKQAEEEFRGRYRALLEANLRAISEVSITDDVGALLGETDEAADLAAVAAAPSAAVELPVFEPPAAEETYKPVMPEPAAPVSFDMPESPKVMPEPEAFVTEAAAPVSPQSTAPMASVEPATSGFVDSITLGELESPEIPADVDLVEPSEFSLPGFAALGEREDDVDIEEID
jgi:cell division initiation protein